MLTGPKWSHDLRSDEAEEAEFRALIPQGVPKDYVFFRCTSTNPVMEALLRADREERARRCQLFTKGTWLKPNSR